MNSDRSCRAEYALLARAAIAALCRKRPSPLSRGRREGWACGVIHALGMVNFLFDSEQSPHLTPEEVYESFGVTAGTGAAKSRAVRDALRMGPFDSNWVLPSLIGANPATWMVMVDGIVVDVRTMPRELQEAAYTSLNVEYAELARAALAALCHKRPSPLNRGRGEGWACGVIHALGMVNFLFDSEQSPHLTARDVYDGFGVSAGTVVHVPCR